MAGMSDEYVEVTALGDTCRTRERLLGGSSMLKLAYVNSKPKLKTTVSWSRSSKTSPPISFGWPSVAVKAKALHDRDPEEAAVIESIIDRLLNS
jgi:hypothetical protein